VIKDDCGVYVLYAHLDPASKLPPFGAQVKAGDTLGLTGSTGAAKGHHLHLEISMPQDGDTKKWGKGARRIDPLDYFLRSGIDLES